MSNLEYIKLLPIEKLAEILIKEVTETYDDVNFHFYKSLNGCQYCTYEDAIKGTIKWLYSDRKE